MYFFKNYTAKFLPQTQEVAHKKSNLILKNLSTKIKNKKNKMTKPLVKPKQKEVSVPPFRPSNNHEKSLKKLGLTIREVFVNKEDAKTFREKLKILNLNPTTNLNSNPYTGTLSIIRTKNNLPGTRYIHAQYFSDSNGNEGLQHLSFEYRPGPNALKRASLAVKSIFGLEGEPTMSSDDFISYKLSKDYNIWLKKMGASDLKYSPFNAYTKNDIGTIRVAIELEIHGKSAGSHVLPDSH